MIQITPKLYLHWDKAPLLAKKIKAIYFEVSEIRACEEIELCYLLLIPRVFLN